MKINKLWSILIVILGITLVSSFDSLSAHPQKRRGNNIEKHKRNQDEDETENNKGKKLLKKADLAMKVPSQKCILCQEEDNQEDMCGYCTACKDTYLHTSCMNQLFDEWLKECATTKLKEEVFSCPTCRGNMDMEVIFAAILSMLNETNNMALSSDPVNKLNQFMSNIDIPTLYNNSENLQADATRELSRLLEDIVRIDEGTRIAINAVVIRHTYRYTLGVDPMFCLEQTSLVLNGFSDLVENNMEHLLNYLEIKQDEAIEQLHKSLPLYHANTTYENFRKILNLNIEIHRSKLYHFSLSARIKAFKQNRRVIAAMHDAVNASIRLFRASANHG